jgi:hypothetical protein
VFAYGHHNVPDSIKGCFRPASSLLQGLPERSRHLVTDDPDRACVFWVELDEIDRKRCPMRELQELPHWHASSGGLEKGGGLNHIFFDIRDEFITLDIRKRRLGRAGIAASSAAWSERMIAGLDVPVSLGVLNYNEPLTTALARTPPWERKWLATFKGSQTHPSRRTIATQHDEAAGFIALSLAEGIHTCRTLPPKIRSNTAAKRAEFQGTIEELAKAKGVSLLEADCCAKWRAAYEQYDYNDVSNATFALVPPGHGAATFRLAEVLRMGSIPVFVGVEQHWAPYGHAPRWDEAALFVPTDVDVHANLLPLLRALKANRPKVRAMQQAALRIYRDWFHGVQMQPLRASVLEVLRRRFEFESDE